jgi:hypothetical protein
MNIEIDIYIYIYIYFQYKKYHITCKQNKQKLCSNMKTYTISKKKTKEKTELINFKCVFEGQNDIFFV